ncbi:hypothetical protein GCM10018965_050900 [Nonomuraea roseola]
MDEQLCGWPRDRLTIMHNPESPMLLAQRLRRLARETEDVLLVYYVGHGTITPGGELCLTLPDTDSDDPDLTGLEHRHIKNALLDSPARIKVAILDCCYSGRAIEALADSVNVIADATATRGVFTLTASEHAAHVVPFAQQTDRATSFTAELIDLIREGLPSGAPFLTLRTLYIHLRRRLAERGLPLPNQRGTETVSEFAFTQNAALAPDPFGEQTVPFRVRPRAQSAPRRPEPPNREQQPRSRPESEPSGRPQSRDGAAPRFGRLDEPREMVEPRGDAAGPDRRATKERPDRGTIVAIDFGMTDCTVSVLRDGRPVMVPTPGGANVTPSIVAFASNGEVLVGEAAQRYSRSHPDRAFRGIKRTLGTAWSPTVDGKTLTPQQFGAFVFQKLKRDAEEFLDETVSKAVITVPALYSERRRQATSEAAQIAGLQVLRMVHEPTAIAAVFGEQIAAEGATYVLVVNLGGGAFDVSLMALEDGVIEVKVTSGDDLLGAEDWNTVIIDWLVQKFRRGHGIDLSLDPLAAERLREAVEQAKLELSSASETTIDLPYLATSGQVPLHLTETLSRARFEQLTKGLLDRCRGVVKVAFADADAVLTDLGGKIDRVVLAGGGSRMPGFADMVRSMAAPGVQTRLAPEYAAAKGAALLGGASDSILVLEVTPLSLGIETAGGVFTKIIERNTTIPTRRSEIFTTAENNQASVRIQVFQGEREIAAYNKRLGVFELAGLPPAPKGVPQIEVTFDIDANGMVNISAKDLGTGREKSVIMTGGSSLPPEEIDRMIREAEEHADRDRTAREASELRVRASALVDRVDEVIGIGGDRIPAAIITEARTAQARVRHALTREASAPGATADLDVAVRALETSAQALGSALYS